MAAFHRHLPVVRLLKEYNFFSINQLDDTPLSSAALANTNSLEMTRFLLLNGADSSQPARSFTPSVMTTYTALIRSLLENGADPNLNRTPPPADGGDGSRNNTDKAIENGNTEMLSVLLERGEFVGHANDHIDGGTSRRSLVSCHA